MPIIQVNVRSERKKMIPTPPPRARPDIGDPAAQGTSPGSVGKILKPTAMWKCAKTLQASGNDETANSKLGSPHEDIPHCMLNMTSMEQLGAR